jgi:hypothetical protein
MDAGGSDSNGREYKTADEMWNEQTGDLNKKTVWYRQGVSYWEVLITIFTNSNSSRIIQLNFIMICYLNRVLMQLWMEYWEVFHMSMNLILVAVMIS